MFVILQIILIRIKLYFVLLVILVFIKVVIRYIRYQKVIGFAKHANILEKKENM